MLIIFLTITAGVLIATPLLLRFATPTLDETDREPLLPDEPATPLPDRLRWLLRAPAALFLGFIVTGVVNEKAAVLALKFGKDVVLDQAGKAVALWPLSTPGKTLELLVLSLPFLLLLTWLDRKFLLQPPPPPDQKDTP